MDGLLPRTVPPAARRLPTDRSPSTEHPMRPGTSGQAVGDASPADHTSVVAPLPRAADVAPRPALRVRAAAAVFSVALFLNAALLFAVQPMFTKAVLPLLGGTPSVWTTALLFFQVALLLGYLYAHHAAGRLPPRAQAAVHVGFVVLAALALPIARPTGWSPPETGSPVPWLLAVLTVSLGAPFLALAAGAPLLQRWFARTGHRSAGSPYFLYAASNAGSLAALLAYPTLIEPRLTLGEQSRAWALVYGALVLLLAACAALAAGRVAVASSAAVAPPAVPTRAPSARERATWTLLSFAPSSLLMGATTYLSTDVAAVPLLWVVPLALYLLSFVFVFARRRVLPHGLMLRLQPLVIAPLAVLMLVGTTKPLSVLATLHLLALFTTAMVCHGELAARRPPPERLTDFYLWLSVGGALGGVFNVLVAPRIFSSVWEYPLVLVLACALRPDLSRPRRPARARVLDVALPFALLLAIVLPVHFDLLTLSLEGRANAAAWGAAGVVAFLFRARPARLALGVAALIGGGVMAKRLAEGPPLFRARSFFGVYTVRADGRYHMLANGTTLHGGQLLREGYAREPLTYYHREGPVGSVFATLPPRPEGRRVAVVGLGAGTLACYAQPADAWTFYEIDPLAERIARDTALFTYLRDCAPRARVVIGDARRSLVGAPAGAYDLVLLDAFSSDAIPVHLLTREAVALYFQRLAAGGLLAVHVSNRHLDLVPVLAELARDARVAGVVGQDANFTEEQRSRLKSSSTWVVLTRRAADLAALARQPGWRTLPPRADVRLWTDDASDLISVFKWR